LNGTILKGSKIRAFYIAEINILPPNTNNISDRLEQNEPQLPNYLNGGVHLEKRTENSNNEEEKPSILSRIKKNNS